MRAVARIDLSYLLGELLNGFPSEGLASDGVLCCVQGV